MFHRKIVERFLTFPSVLGDQWIQFQKKKPIGTPAVSLVLLPVTQGARAQEFDIPKGWGFGKVILGGS